MTYLRNPGDLSYDTGLIVQVGYESAVYLSSLSLSLSRRVLCRDVQSYIPYVVITSALLVINGVVNAGGYLHMTDYPTVRYI